MQLVAGEYYKTRDGRKSGPAKFEDGTWSSCSEDTGRWVFDPDGKLAGFNDPDCEDLVSPWLDAPSGPIRTETVTTRRIEPGVYGRLSIDHDAPGYVSIGLTDPKGTGVEEGHRRSFNSAQLRELARVATELAEYLDVAWP